MRKKKIYIFLLAIYIFINFNIYANDKKAILKAEEVIYGYKKEIISAKGDAVLKYDDVKIRCQELRVDVQKNIVETFGFTELTRGDDIITGINLRYDLDQEKGEFFNIYFEDVSENGEPMFFTGETMKVSEEIYKYDKSYFTSCDREHPHYYFTAKQVEYYPGNRIVFYQIIYYENKYPIFYLPKLVVSLEDKKNNFSESSFGFNKNDGWFLKAVYRYYLESGGDGRLLLDLYEKRGVGGGVLHNFELDPTKNLSLSYYYFSNKITLGEDYQIMAAWEHDVNSSLFYSLNYEYWLNILNYGGRYGFWEEDHYFLSRVIGRNSVYPFTLNLEMGIDGLSSDVYDPLFWAKPDLNLQWNLTDYTRLSYVGFLDYKKSLYDNFYSTDWVEQKYRYMFSLDQDIKVNDDYYRFRAEVYKSMSSSPNAYWQDWNRWPYLFLESPYYNLGTLGNYQIKIDYLFLQEVPSYKKGERFEYIFNRQNQPIFELLGNFTLNLVGSWRQQEYIVDEKKFKREAFTYGIEGIEKFTPEIAWVNSLTWTKANGKTPKDSNFYNYDPFLYQLVNNDSYYMPYANIRSGLSYNKNSFRINLDGGYNINIKKDPWHLVSLSANWYEDQFNQMLFNTTYNPNTREYKNITLSYKYEPDALNHLNLDMVYSPVMGKWSTCDVDIKLTQKLSHKIQADINLLYSFFGDGLEESRFGIIYDWHCREVYVGYDTIRQEYTFQFQYKVFPNAGFGFGNSDQGFIMEEKR